MKKGNLLETELGIAIVLRIDDDYPHLVHIMIGRRKGLVYDVRTGEVKDYFSAVLDITFENVMVEDINNVRKQVRNDMISLDED